LASLPRKASEISNLASPDGESCRQAVRMIYAIFMGAESVKVINFFSAILRIIK
jgi:hypothetical protein